MGESERMQLMDMGYYNGCIKGYLIRALQIAEFDRDDIKKALNGMRWALDEMTAAEAAEEYRSF